jgi:SAM-dependent methyltransferase
MTLGGSDARSRRGRSEAGNAAAFTCRICGTIDGTEWNAREMMFGLRDSFSYFECSGCGCLQLMRPPADMARYYPPDYYSLARAAPPSGLRGWLRRRRNSSIFTPRGLLGRALAAGTRYPYAALGYWFTRHPLGTRARVLDVGCGSGSLIHDLALAGYPEPLGVDPFVNEDIEYKSGARVLKREIYQVNGRFDLILLNHSLEHVGDQVGTLLAVRNLLHHEGWCVVRTPLSSSYAWRHYRSDWVQLDPPRHLVVHSLDSLTRVARAAGLEAEEVNYDSDEFQFVGSELYRQDIPLREGAGVFSRREIRAFRARAVELNEWEQGDQAGVLLRPA